MTRVDILKGNFSTTHTEKNVPRTWNLRKYPGILRQTGSFFLRKIIILQILITSNVPFIIWWICPKIPKGYNYGQNVFYSINLLLSSFNILKLLTFMVYFINSMHSLHILSTAPQVCQTVTIPPFLAHKSHHGPSIHFFVVWKCIEIISPYSYFVSVCNLFIYFS